MTRVCNIHQIESEELQNILSKECQDFIAELHKLFNPKRLHLLEERKKVEPILANWLLSVRLKNYGYDYKVFKNLL